jgi:hypothetical protein
MLIAGWVQRQQAATIDHLKAVNPSSASASQDGASFLVAQGAGTLLGRQGQWGARRLRRKLLLRKLAKDACRHGAVQDRIGPLGRGAEIQRAGAELLRNDRSS